MRSRPSRVTGTTLFLLVAAVLLGWRAERAVNAVQASGVLRSTSIPKASEDPVLEHVLSSDSLLAAIVPITRDPLRPPPLPSSSGRSVATAPAPSGDDRAAPQVRALLFDRVRPSAQIEVGETTSGWLHEGDSFSGWTIARIQTDGVRIERGGESLLLPPP